VTLDEWVGAHPYLRPIADLHNRLEAAIRSASPTSGDARWDEYAPEFGMGVPLLVSAEAAVDLGPASRRIRLAVEDLAEGALDDELAAEAHALALEIRERDDRSPMDWLLGGDDGWNPSRPGLLRCVGWMAAESTLRPLLIAFDRWRDDDRWLRRYCPACGSLPAMAQLVGKDPGRRRLLCCGCCRTRWRYARTGCPFCETESHRLAALAPEGAHGLRIDYCDACRGYLKTYDGEGSEAVMLADWTSVHLDVLALDRGLTRCAPSLYAFDAVAGPDSITPEAARLSGGTTVTAGSERGGKRFLTH
jgi:FdhE protein